jgi:hypothetical protein
MVLEVSSVTGGLVLILGEASGCLASVPDNTRDGLVFEEIGKVA